MHHLQKFKDGCVVDPDAFWKRNSQHAVLLELPVLANSATKEVPMIGLYKIL
jgi:hypothetical protein